MIDVQIQSHTDRIGCHQIIDIAVLIQFHLRIPRARAKCPHDHGGPAFLSADQFGNGIDIINRKPNNRAARGHATDFFRPCID